MAELLQGPKIPSTPTTKKFDLKKVVFTSIIVLVTAGVLAAGIYWYLSSMNDTSMPSTNTKQSTKSASNSSSATGSAKKDETADWKTYTSKKFKYSIKYPREWISKVLEEERESTEYETVFLNIKENEVRQNGKPNITIFGNFEGDFCNPGSDGVPSCKIEEVTINSIKGKKFTYLKFDEVVYSLRTIIIITSSSDGDKALIEKVVGTLKFL